MEESQSVAQIVEPIGGTQYIIKACHKVNKNATYIYINK